MISYTILAMSINHTESAPGVHCEARLIAHRSTRPSASDSSLLIPTSGIGRRTWWSCWGSLPSTKVLNWFKSWPAMWAFHNFLMQFSSSLVCNSPKGPSPFSAASCNRALKGSSCSGWLPKYFKTFICWRVEDAMKMLSGPKREADILAETFRAQRELFTWWSGVNPDTTGWPEKNESAATVWEPYWPSDDAMVATFNLIICNSLGITSPKTTPSMKRLPSVPVPCPINHSSTDLRACFGSASNQIIEPGTLSRTSSQPFIMYSVIFPRMEKLQIMYLQSRGNLFCFNANCGFAYWYGGFE